MQTVASKPNAAQRRRDRSRSRTGRATGGPWLALALVVPATVPACRNEPTAATSRAAAAEPEASAAYYLERGDLEQKHARTAQATTAYEAAIASGDAREQGQAWAALSRLREADGKLDAAIEAQQQALAVTDGLDEGGLRRDQLLRLAELCSQAELLEDAEAAYLRAIEATATPLDRQRLRARYVAWLGEVGWLEQRVTEWSAARDADAEPGLWLLAIAYGAAAGSAPGVAVGPTPVGVTPQWPELVGVYERLAALHPDDATLRAALQEAYERTGQLDRALALVRAPQQDDELAAPAPRCPQGLVPNVPKPDEVVRIERELGVYLRAQQRDRARDEALALAARDKQLGVWADVAAARILWVLDETTQADKALARADKLARSPEERRLVAARRLEGLERRSDARAIAALLDQWSRSSDPCLAEAAHVHAAELARLQGIPAADTGNGRNSP